MRSVGQTFACVGAKDPRLDDLGKTDFRLARQLKAYTKGDPPLTRVHPMPLVLLSCLVEFFSTGSDKSQAIADLAMIAFFFMLRPGEYCSGGSDVQKSPFRIKDVQFGIDQRDIPAIKITKSQHHKLTIVSLTFTDQKNGVKGGSITHGRTTDLKVDPVQCVLNRIMYLHQHGAPATIALCSYLHKNVWTELTASDITEAMRVTVRAHGKQFGLLDSDISARSMRAGGAMALLLAGVPEDTIKLLGRWKSNAVLAYLHISAKELTKGYSQKMFSGGNYTLVPHS